MDNTRHPQFPLDQDIIYLNHAAVAPWPLCTADAIKQFTDENLHSGARHYPRWMETEKELRALLAWLINASDADDIALLKNTSEGLSVIAYGLDWHSGDNVVIPAGEFPSNRIVWESLQRFGVEIRIVDILHADDAETVLIQATDERTRLVSVSSVQYANGFRLDLKKIGQHTRAHNILFVVDAIQHLGALQFDVQEVNADFVVADGHKWMLGPEGLALFYSTSAARNKLDIKQYGWHMVQHPGNFDLETWEIADTATRFECGSPNMLAIHALKASIQLLRDTGMQQVQNAVLGNAGRIIVFVQQSDLYELISHPDPERRSGIVTFRHKSKDNHSLYKQLMSDGIICAERGGGIRFSAHFYHQDWEFDKLFSYLSSS